MKKIFIADDSLIVCARLISLFSEIENLSIVGSAQNGIDAIDAIKRTEPDVVILDIQMPKANGLEVLQAIKTFSPTTVVIILTNYPLVQIKNQSMNAGADYFYDKSADIDKMLETVRKLANNGQVKTS